MADHVPVEPHLIPASSGEEGSAPLHAGESVKAVFYFWFPLAVSWILMTVGNPTVNAIIARLPDAKFQLAAFGIAHSLTMAIQSPVVALLTTSVAFSRDRSSHQLVRRFTLLVCVLMTVIMVVLVATPAFDLVVRRWIGAPAEVADYVRPALMAFVLFPASVAYRRFRQGMMILQGYTRGVTWGSVFRLSVAVSVALLGLLYGKVNGALVGGLAMVSGIIAEAIAVHFLSRSAARKSEQTARSQGEPPLTWKALLSFYWPLALTSMVWLWAPSLISFGLVRSPHPLESLAVWPVVSGQISILSSFGFSYLEVVVALLKYPQAITALRRFATALSVGSLLLLLAIAFTPLAPLWQGSVAGLDDELTGFAIPALRLGILLPVVAVLLSWFRGIVVTVKATQTIAQATVINVTILVLALVIGASVGWLPGASIAAIALTVSRLAETAWLWRRARPAQVCMRKKARDSGVVLPG